VRNPEREATQPYPFAVSVLALSSRVRNPPWLWPILGRDRRFSTRSVESCEESYQIAPVVFQDIRFSTRSVESCEESFSPTGRGWGGAVSGFSTRSVESCEESLLGRERRADNDRFQYSLCRVV